MTNYQNQFVQCFQISIDDFIKQIIDAVKSELPDFRHNTSNEIEKSDNLEDDLLSPKEVQKILKISSPTLWRYSKNGNLEVKSKIGRKIYYSKKEVYEFIENNKP